MRRSGGAPVRPCRDARGTHALAPLSFRAAAIRRLHPAAAATGKAAHHGEIPPRRRAWPSRKITPPLAPQRFTLATVGDAYRQIAGGTGRGKLVDVAAS